MARWQPARADVIAEYAREAIAVHPRGRLVIGIDGIEQPAAGDRPSTRMGFATDLAAALDREGVPSVAVPMGEFAVDPLPADPAALTDLAAFRAQVLTPYRAGRPIAFSTPTADGWVTRGFDPPERAALVVSGAFLHLGDLAGIWHTSAWIALPRAAARKRDAARLPGVDPEPWTALVDLAFRRVDARKLANATFDLTDPEHPLRRFEDAC